MRYAHVVCSLALLFGVIGGTSAFAQQTSDSAQKISSVASSHTSSVPASNSSQKLRTKSAKSNNLTSKPEAAAPRKKQKSAEELQEQAGFHNVLPLLTESTPDNPYPNVFVNENRRTQTALPQHGQAQMANQLRSTRDNHVQNSQKANAAAAKKTNPEPLN